MPLRLLESRLDVLSTRLPSLSTNRQTAQEHYTPIPLRCQRFSFHFLPFFSKPSFTHPTPTPHRIPKGNDVPRAFRAWDTVFLNIQLWWHVDFVGDVPSVLFSLSDTLRKKVFDLTVDRAEIILCPCGDRLVKL